MLRPTRRQPLGHLAELNITPLLDLSFVLLVIFMITAPLLGNRNIDLVLPTSEADATSIPQDNYYTLIIDGGGQIFLEEQPIAKEELVPRLEDLLAEAVKRGDEIAVIVQADARLRVEQIVPVFDQLTEAGIVHTALVSRPAGN